MPKSFIFWSTKGFPENEQPMIIYHEDPLNKPEIIEIKDALNMTIAACHLLDYHIQTFPGTPDGSCAVVISAPFEIFNNGSRQIGATVDKGGVWPRSSDPGDAL